MAIILEVNNISKQYRLGLVGTGTLSDDLKRWWYKIRGRENPFLKLGDINDRSLKASSDYVWALKDISFKMNEGEVLGIIGKNGAGKSTLLKILSRVTSPTIGEIKTKGRIASLLEVGTGFHPELTGKENIYLNGAILGMTKDEIQGKEEEIIEFSGCERYIDTPVKRYSSGMRVRLAFAVAAFLEPDILVIDEVLAVGDAEFQKKAIGKMQDISKGDGRTVLFVSHNMAAVKSLCTRALVLEHGEIAYNGTTDEAVSYYLQQGVSLDGGKLNLNNLMLRSEVLKINTIYIKNSFKNVGEPISENETIELITDFNLLDMEQGQYHITYHLYNELGENMFSFSNEGVENELIKGRNILCCKIPQYFLQPGQFFLTLLLVKNRKKAVFIARDLLSFVVVNASRDIGVYMGREPGYIRPKFEWKRMDSL